MKAKMFFTGRIAALEHLWAWPKNFVHTQYFPLTPRPFSKPGSAPVMYMYTLFAMVLEKKWV